MKRKELIFAVTSGVIGGGKPAISVAGNTDFGTTTIGTPDSEIFTVSGVVTITAITLPAGFSQNHALPWAVTALDNTFTVTALATSAGTYSGNVSITSTGLPNPYEFAITATVTAQLYSDLFTGTVSAPIPAGSADVRGYRVVNDAENLMTIGSGVLNVPTQASAVWGDEYYRAQPSSGQQYWTRPANHALVAMGVINLSTQNSRFFGWWNSSVLNSGNVRNALLTSGSSVNAYVGTTTVSDNQSYAANTDVPIAAVWTSTGYYVYVKLSGTWHLKWYTQQVDTQAYCGMSNFNAAGALKSFEIYAIPESLFAPALSISNPSVGNLADMPDGDFLLYLGNVTRPSAAEIDLRYRKKDATNLWRQRVKSNGVFEIYEMVAGVSALRVSSGTVVSTDDIINIARGASISSRRNTTAMGAAYTSAYNWAREVGLELNSLGTGGAIGALYAWKARLLDYTGLGSELVVNGDFATDTVWGKGTGWSIAAGVATKVAGVQSSLTQASLLTTGGYYEITLTVSSYVAGGLLVFLGGNAGQFATISANGTYTFKGVADGATILLTGDATFAGSIDNVSCKKQNFSADALALVLDGLAV